MASDERAGMTAEERGGGALRQYEIAHWFRKTGAALAKEVDRLWPHENDPAYRAACLAEEAGEVNRAVTKRRHAAYAADGRCKGRTVDEWTDELRVELGQTLGVILDIAHRERIDLVPALEQCLGTLQRREAGADEDEHNAALENAVKER